MSNMRVLYDNKADSAATLTASTTAGDLVASNLLTDRKADVHRSTGTAVQYTLTWAAATWFSVVWLVFTNLTSTSTMRVRVYTNTGDATPVLDSGAGLCCAYQVLGGFPWGFSSLAVNAFQQGGYSYARRYFTPTLGRKLVIDVSDADSSQGYIEIGRLVTGQYWSPEKNADYGAGVRPNSNTRHDRSEAGDLVTPRRAKSRAIRLNLGLIESEADRFVLWNILAGNGMNKPLMISLFPEDTYPAREQTFQLWGKLASDSEMSHPTYGIFAAPLEIEEA